MKRGDFCAQHQGQRSFPGFAGSGPVPSNPYLQQFPGRFPAGSTYTLNNYNTNVHTLIHTNSYEWLVILILVVTIVFVYLL
jgi:hypothetical protein